MKSRIIYCEVDFLKKFFSLFAIAQNNFEKTLSWLELYKFIYYSPIYINKPKGELGRDIKNDERLLKLFKSGAITYVSNYPNFNSLDTISFDKQMKNSVFFSSASKEKRDFNSSLYGVLILGEEDIFSFSFYIKEKKYPILKNQRISWSEIIPACFNVSNSLIIADKYLLKDTATIEENLIQLLDKLLPKHLPYCYPIIIYTFDLGNQGKKKFGYLKNRIKEIRSNLDFCLSIYMIRKNDIHDRNIITNNIYIECGGGFDLIKREKSSKTTNIHSAYPFLVQGNSGETYRESYYNFISTISEIEKRNFKLDFDYWAEEKHKDDENMLVKYYNQDNC